MRAHAIVVAACLACGTVSALEPPPLTSGIEIDGLDRSVRPQDDLFRFVNGRWLDDVAMPEDRVYYGTFIELADTVESDVRAIVEQAAPKGADGQRVADLWSSMTDEATLDARGAQPLEPQLAAIDRVTSLSGLAAEAGRLSAHGLGGPFSASVDTTTTEPHEIVVRVSQGGVLLPERGDYLSDGPAFTRIKDAYERYLREIFTLAQRRDPAAEARAAIAFETELARASAPLVERVAEPTPASTFTLARLPKELPGFDWTAWARPQGIDRAQFIILEPPSFFRTFAALVAATPLDTLKAWLAARYITAAAPYVANAFGDARFEFFGRLLTGQEAPRVRWKRAVAIVNGYLGDAVGRLYVASRFSSSAKTRATTLVRTIVQAYRTEVDRAAWMPAKARRTALEKLATLSIKIGYPDRWHDYTGLTIKRDDLLGNVQRAQEFENDRRMARLRAVPDPAEWLVTPQAVNAYYSPGANEIVVPAAMLQKPLFDPAADDAVNYGAIGAIVAHEITHALDGAPELRARARPLVAQVGRYTPIEGVPVNGTLTFRENAADLGGLEVAFRAYLASLGGRRSPTLDGFTGEQRFFLSWARLWRSKERDPFLRQWLLTNPYAPNRFRANGVVSNTAAFYDAFRLAAGDRLFRASEDRVAIW